MEGYAPDDALCVLDILLRGLGLIVFVDGILCSYVILIGGDTVRIMLRLGRCLVLVLEYNLLDVSCHGYVQILFLFIPLEFDDAVEFAFPIGG